MRRNLATSPVSRFLVSLAAGLALVTAAAAPAAACDRPEPGAHGRDHDRSASHRRDAETTRGGDQTAGGVTGRKIG
jgi:hypothetical protein